MTDGIDTEDEMVLAAEYALWLLSPAEENAIEDLLAADPEMRDHYAKWIEIFANLTDDVAPVSPPDALEERINEALFGPPKKKSSLVARVGFARFGALNPVLGGLAAVAVVLFALSQTDILRDDGPSFVAEVVLEDANFVFQARFDPETGALVMNQTAGGPGTGRTLEV